MIGVEEIALKFSATSDEEANRIFRQAVEAGEVGYSKANPTRVGAKLYRSKVWYNKNK